MVDLVIEKLQQFVQNAPQSDSSLTYIPFYDTILPMNKRNLLGQVKMSPAIVEKVKRITQASLSVNETEHASKQQREQKQAMLIKFRPEKSTHSKLLNDFQISNLSEYMHMHRNMKWVLLYRLSEHGVSMNTFLKRCKMYDDTLMIVVDSKGHKFGGF